MLLQMWKTQQWWCSCGDHKGGIRAMERGRTQRQERVAQGGKGFPEGQHLPRGCAEGEGSRAPRQRNSACNGLLSWGTPKSREEAGRHQRGQLGWGRVAKGKGWRWSWEALMPPRAPQSVPHSTITASKFPQVPSTEHPPAWTIWHRQPEGKFSKIT